MLRGGISGEVTVKNERMKEEKEGREARDESCSTSLTPTVLLITVFPPQTNNGVSHRDLPAEHALSPQTLEQIRSNLEKPCRAKKRRSASRTCRGSHGQAVKLDRKSLKSDQVNFQNKIP